jgi:choline dehydrogenase
MHFSTIILYISNLSLIASAVARPQLLGSLLNPITNTLQTLPTAPLNTAIDSLKGTLGTQQSFDYVVVGGGTAGNTLAYRLAKAGNTVALIEAGLSCEVGKPIVGPAPLGCIIGVGANPADTVPTVDYGFITVPQAGAGGRSMHYAQGKCLGGSSSLNFMIHHRPNRGALEAWANAVGDDTYKFDSFLPYFRKSFNFKAPNTQTRLANATTLYNTNDFLGDGQGGPIQVTYPKWTPVWSTWAAKGLQAIGLGISNAFNAGVLSGYHYAQTTINAADQTRSTSANFILEASNEKLPLTLYMLARANKVLFDGNKKSTGVQVTGVDLLTYIVSAKKEVILSAGALASPQLLMLSGIGPAAHLQQFGINVIANRPGVGQNLTDHALFGPSYEVTFDTLNRVLGDPAVLASSVTKYTTNQTGPLTSNVAEFLAWERIPGSSKLSQTTKDALAAFPTDWPNIEYFPAAGHIGTFDAPWMHQPKGGKQYTSILGALASPLSRGNISLASADPSAKPLLNPNWLTHPADVEVAISIYRRIRQIYNTTAVRSIRASAEEYWPGYHVETDEQILANLRTSVMAVMHASVTNRMGRKDDPTAVVDNLARVIGVQGLRVVDASSLALLPPGHPQAVIYALAEKIADAIIQGKT